jgi:predicted RNA binding protein YcfA (HicA-like mRNA interferase family)
MAAAEPSPAAVMTYARTLDALPAFELLGWTQQPKRGKAPHMIMTKPGHRATLSFPDHDPVKTGTLAALLRAAECSEAEYLATFGKRH